MVRVLFPLDGSQAGYKAFEHAVGMLAPKSLEGTVFVVRQKGFETAAPEVIEEFSRDEDDEVFPDEASARVVFEEARKRAGPGVKLAFKTTLGIYKEEILREAAGHDLLVMHAPSEHHVLRKKGSLSIAEHSPCDVLLLRTK